MKTVFKYAAAVSVCVAVVVLSLFMPRILLTEATASLLNVDFPRPREAAELSLRAAEIDYVKNMYLSRQYIYSINDGMVRYEDQLQLDVESSLLTMQNKANELYDAGLLPDAVQAILLQAPVGTVMGTSFFKRYNLYQYSNQKDWTQDILICTEPLSGKAINMTWRQTQAVDPAPLLESFIAYMEIPAEFEFEAVTFTGQYVPSYMVGKYYEELQLYIAIAVTDEVGVYFVHCSATSISPKDFENVPKDESV